MVIGRCRNRFHRHLDGFRGHGECRHFVGRERSGSHTGHYRGDTFICNRISAWLAKSKNAGPHWRQKNSEGSHASAVPKLRINARERDGLQVEAIELQDRDEVVDNRPPRHAAAREYLNFVENGHPGFPALAAQSGEHLRQGERVPNVKQKRNHQIHYRENYDQLHRVHLALRFLSAKHGEHGTETCLGSKMTSKGCRVHKSFEALCERHTHG